LIEMVYESGAENHWEVNWEDEDGDHKFPGAPASFLKSRFQQLCSTITSSDGCDGYPYSGFSDYVHRLWLRGDEIRTATRIPSKEWDRSSKSKINATTGVGKTSGVGKASGAAAAAADTSSETSSVMTGIKNKRKRNRQQLLSMTKIYNLHCIPYPFLCL